MSPVDAGTERLPRLTAAHKTRTGVSDAELASRVGISRQNLFIWRTTGVKTLSAREHLDTLVDVVDVPYEIVLDAALRDAGYLPHHAGVFDDCLDPALRTSAGQLARESVNLNSRAPRPGHLVIGTGAVRVLARLWRTWPDRAVQYLWDYRQGLHEADPSASVTWDQIADGLCVALGGLLTRDDRDALLDRARQWLDDRKWKTLTRPSTTDN